MQDSCIISTALPIFSWSRNTKKPYTIWCDASGSHKFKMAVLKEEILISQHVYNILRKSNGNTHVSMVMEFNEDIFILCDAT